MTRTDFAQTLCRLAEERGDDNKLIHSASDRAAMYQTAHSIFAEHRWISSAMFAKKMAATIRNRA